MDIILLPAPTSSGKNNTEDESIGSAIEEANHFSNCIIITENAELENHEEACKDDLAEGASIVTFKDGRQKYLCDICLKTFKYIKEINQHKERHRPPGGFICRYCDEKFCTHEERVRHTEDKHKVFKCQLCKELFDTLDKYLEHINEVHNGRDREYTVCENCGHQFKSATQLHIHMESKCGTEKMFTCDECGLKYMTQATLNAHKMIHKGEKTFQCSYCKKSFLSKGQLTVHKRKHTGEKPYKCRLCPKAFSYRESLVTHSSLHTGIKPYMCECCGSTFSCIGNLLKHRRLRPYNCGLPQYNKNTKVAPRPSLKNNGSLTTTPVKIIKIRKVLKAKEKEIKSKTTSTISQGNIKTATENQTSDASNSENDLLNEMIIPDDAEDIMDNVEENIELISYEEFDEETEKDNIELKKSFETVEAIGDVHFIAKSENEYIVEIKNIVENSGQKNINNDRDKSNVSTLKGENGQIQLENGNDVTIFEIVKEEYNVKGQNTHEKTVKEDNENLQIDFDEDIMYEVIEKVDESSDDQGNDTDLIDGDMISDVMQEECNRNDDANINENSDEESENLIVIEKILPDSCSSDDNSLSKIFSQSNNESTSTSMSRVYESQDIITEICESEEHIIEAKSPSPVGDISIKTKHCESFIESDNMYECLWCPKIYHHRKPFVKHLKFNHKKSDADIEELVPENNRNMTTIKCTYCSRKYVSLTALEKHQSKHGPNGKLIHKSSCCQEYFETPEEAEAHVREKHNDKITCNICKRVYSDPESLSAHCRYAHRGKEGEKRKTPKQTLYICPKCGKKCSTKTALLDHERSDCGQSPLYKCDTCGKYYHSSGSLKIHQTVHTGELPYKCSYCDKAFRTQGQVKIHQRRHNGEKPFKCDRCPKEFAYRENLLIHVSIHTGMLRFMCQNCGVRFSCISNLQSHRKIHKATCGLKPNITKPIGKIMGVANGSVYVGDKSNTLDSQCAE